MKEIQLTNSPLKAMVDDEDYSALISRTWYLANSYAYTSPFRNGKWAPIAMHAMLISIPTGMMCDHKNRNPLDNRRHNLRPATMGQNVQNRMVRKDKKSSRFKGTVFNKRTQKWGARIAGTWIGTFDSETEAAKAYNYAAIQLFGEFSCLNKL